MNLHDSERRSNPLPLPAIDDRILVYIQATIASGAIDYDCFSSLLIRARCLNCRVRGANRESNASANTYRDRAGKSARLIADNEGDVGVNKRGDRRDR